MALGTRYLDCRNIKYIAFVYFLTLFIVHYMLQIHYKGAQTLENDTLPKFIREHDKKKKNTLKRHDHRHDDRMHNHFNNSSHANIQISKPNLRDISINVNKQRLDPETAILRTATQMVPPILYDAHYSNVNLCKRNPKMKYFIYVHTAPSNFKRRHNLRRTWANKDIFKDNRTSVGFFMGRTDNQNVNKQLKEEMQTYGDIVQGDFVDSYHNMTIKGIFALNWISKHCSRVKFTIKSDDDAFINIFSLIKKLESYSNNNRTVLCARFNKNSMPILRNPTNCHKWCVKESEFKGQKYFPPYCSGLAYVTTTDILSAVVKASFVTNYFWIDDIYITGLLMGQVKNVEYITLFDHILFYKDTVNQYSSKTTETKVKMLAHTAGNMDVFFDRWDVSVRGLSAYERTFLNENALTLSSQSKH